MSLVELLPEYVQAGALVLAGGWGYWRFFHQRGDEPATDIDVDVSFLGWQDDQHLVEVTAVLENKSLVRHSYEDFRMSLRYLRHGDPVVDGDSRFNHQVNLPHTIDDRLEQEGDAGVGRFFANVAYINPRQRFQHRYETFVPADATFVRAHCRFTFHPAPRIRLLRRAAGGTPVLVDAQRMFKVPDPPTV